MTKIFISTDSVHSDFANRITAGKEYEALFPNIVGFSFYDDRGTVMHAIWEGSYCINRGNWNIIEKEVDK